MVQDVVPTKMARYQYSQSLLTADRVILIPGILRVPIRRHFILPKDKIGLADHLGQYFFPSARLLELFLRTRASSHRKNSDPQSALVGSMMR